MRKKNNNSNLNLFYGKVQRATSFTMLKKAFTPSNSCKANSTGFTLVELIITIIIIAILGTIVFIAFQGYSSQSRDSVRISDMLRMKTGLELFKLESGKYPIPTDGDEVTFSGDVLVWTQGYFGETVYSNIEKLDKIPKDPKTDMQYVYSTTNTRQEFQLAGVMERDEISYQPHINRVGGLYGEVNVGEFLGIGLKGSLSLNASTKIARLKITGNYNSKFIKTNISGKECLLAIPSIISSSGKVLEEIIESDSLAYDGYRNLPYQYSKNYKVKGENNLKLVNKRNIETFCSDNLNILSSLEQDGINSRRSLVEGLQKAYSGTYTQQNSEISKIIKAKGKTEIEVLSSTMLNNYLGMNIVLKDIKPHKCSHYGTIIEHLDTSIVYSLNTIEWDASENCSNKGIQGTITCNDGNLEGDTGFEYFECVKGTPNNCEANSSYEINGRIYNVLQLNHGISSTPTVDIEENNGTFRYTFNALCNDGEITGNETGPEVQSCNSGYFVNGNECTLSNYTVSGSFGANANGATINVCGTNVTANTSGGFSVTRNYGSICNNITATRTNYTCSTTTNGPASLTSNTTNIAGSCVANTQTASCTSKPSNSLWNTVSSITQTWNGSAWSPSTTSVYNTTASTTTCRFKCNTGYLWNGSGCYTYSWYTGSRGSCSANPSWGSRGSCSVSCGGGTQYRSCNGTSGSKTRTVYCRRNDGVSVSDSYCSGGKPSSSTSCTESCIGSNSRSCNTHSCCVSYMGNSCVIDVKYSGCIPDFSFSGWPGYSNCSCTHSGCPTYYSNCNCTKYGTYDCNGNCN